MMRNIFKALLVLYLIFITGTMFYQSYNLYVSYLETGQIVPDDVLKIFIYFIEIIVLMIVLYFIYFKAKLLHRKLKKVGVKTMAKLVNAIQTGSYVNKMPVVKFTFQISNQEGNTRNIEFKEVLDYLEIQTIMSRQNHLIVYNPKNPKQAMICEVGRF